MQQSYSSAFIKLIQQIEKFRRQLQSFSENGAAHSFYTKQVLQKRYKRSLQKLATLVRPALKTGIALGLAATLHSSSVAQKQPCDTFYKAVNSNPITRVPLPYKGLSKPAFVDIDGDGDYDCYEEYYDSPKGGSGLHPSHIVFLRNNGTRDIPYFQQDTTNYGFSPGFTFMSGVYPSVIEGTVFVDIDNDGDYDCLIGAYADRDTRPSTRFFENTGSASKPIFTERTGARNPFSFISGYYRLFFTLADLDSDGDYDLVTSRSYRQEFYKNVGTPEIPAFEMVKSEQSLIVSSYKFYDWNKDGLLDEFYLGQYYENKGTPKLPKFVLSNKGPILPIDIQQFADINNDGFIDLFGFSNSFASTASDVFIKADSSTKTLQAYPKNASFTYRWQRNGKQIPGATADHFIPINPGLYTVQITGTCGTGVSYPYTFKTNQKTLIGENEDSYIAQKVVTNKSLPDGAIKSYPNPFTNSFVLELNSDADISKTAIRITDVQGRVVEVIKPNSYTVHAGEKLSKGLYMVQVKKGNEVLYEQKVMKKQERFA